MKEKKVVKKKKLRLRGLLTILLASYLLISIGYYLWQMPVKEVNFIGNNYLKDSELMAYLDTDNLQIFRLNSSKIKKNLMKLELVKDAKIHKNIWGTLTIEITEDKVLFYNLNNKKTVLASGKEIDKNDFLGIPTLINYVPENIYKEFITKFAKIKDENIALISEIEYSPSIVLEKVVDDKRFLFRMNDGNNVYINTLNIEKFNDYLGIFEAIVSKNGDVRGCLYLDSNSENNHFNNCYGV